MGPFQTMGHFLKNYSNSSNLRATFMQRKSTKNRFGYILGDFGRPFGRFYRKTLGRPACKWKSQDTLNRLCGAKPALKPSGIVIAPQLP
jgi:hypothetical protein